MPFWKLLNDMDWISIGRVTRTHGLKGELKFFPTDRDRSVIKAGQRIQFRGNESKVESVRGAKSPLIVKFDGINSIESAKSLAGQEVLVAREDFELLPEGEYYRF